MFKEKPIVQTSFNLQRLAKKNNTSLKTLLLMLTFELTIKRSDFKPLQWSQCICTYVEQILMFPMLAFL